MCSVKLTPHFFCERNKRTSRQMNPVLKITELMLLLMLTVQVTYRHKTRVYVSGADILFTYMSELLGHSKYAYTFYNSAIFCK